LLGDRVLEIFIRDCRDIEQVRILLDQLTIQTLARDGEERDKWMNTERGRKEGRGKSIHNRRVKITTNSLPTERPMLCHDEPPSVHFQSYAC
jgi:hypothetical protein